MSKKAKKPKELFYITPMHIFNIKELNGDCKLLLSHIYSFGIKGCWQSNETLAEIFQTSPGTISRWISKIKKHLYIKCPKGYYRTLWVKSHPDVIENVKLHYRGKDIPVPNQNNITNNDKEHTQKCSGHYSKSAVRDKQNCVPIIKTINKETITKTTEPPSPLPASGQSPAALIERKQAAKDSITKFSKRFGNPHKREHVPLTENQFRDRVMQQRKSLYALKNS